MERQIRYARILTLLFLIIMILLTATSFIYIDGLAKNAIKKSVEQNLLNSASVIASQIDGDSFSTIGPGDEKTIAYGRVWRTLNTARNADQSILYVYTMRMNHSQLEFVVDADYGIFSSGAVPGQVYTRSTESLLLGFSAPSVEKEFATDEWGTTLSGYAPILDQRGMTVGIVGVDIDSNLVMQHLQFIHVIYYAIMILLLVVLVLGALIFDIRRSRAETMLVSANKKLNLLNGIIRHDVINTLTALMGYEEMAEEIAKEPEIQQYLKVISQQTRKIHRQIEFTRDYQDLGLSMPLWQNVEEVAKTAASAIKLGSVELRIEFSGIEIYADPHLSTVFSTIFGNSIEHGGSVEWIRGYFEIREGDAFLIIEDNGAGIPENKKDAIFSRKYYKNTGLSLLLTKEILGMTELSIRETGEPGKGARFEIIVPRSKYRLTGKDPNLPL